MERKIQLKDGSTITIEGDTITEFEGDVYVFPESASAAGLLTGEIEYDKYENATIV